MESQLGGSQPKANFIDIRIELVRLLQVRQCLLETAEAIIVDPEEKVRRPEIRVETKSLFECSGSRPEFILQMTNQAEPLIQIRIGMRVERGRVERFGFCKISRKFGCSCFGTYITGTSRPHGDREGCESKSSRN